MLGEILSFFVSDAFAQTAPAATPNPQGGGMSLMLMLLVFFFFIYFGIWRPQSKRAKEQQNLLSSLNKGDEVVTAGGIIGRITKLSDQYLSIAVNNNVEMVIQKVAVVNVLPKGTLKSIE